MLVISLLLKPLLHFVVFLLGLRFFFAGGWKRAITGTSVAGKGASVFFSGGEMWGYVQWRVLPCNIQFFWLVISGIVVYNYLRMFLQMNCKLISIT